MVKGQNLSIFLHNGITKFLAIVFKYKVPAFFIGSLKKQYTSIPAVRRKLLSFQVQGLLQIFRDPFGVFEESET